MEDKRELRPEPDTNILQSVLEKYTPYWPVFAISIAICVFITFIYVRAQPRIYLTTAKVLLKDPNKGSPDSKLLDALNIFGEKKLVENEVVVLRSADIMNEVVKALGLYANVNITGRVRTQEIYGPDLPVQFIAANPDSVYTSPKFPFTINWNEKTIVIDGKKVAFNSFVTLNRTKYFVKPNLTFKPETIGDKSYYVTFLSPLTASQQILHNLTANPISKSSSVITLQLECQVKEKGIDILNGIFSRYNENSVEDKNLTAAKTMKFIEERLKVVISQLDSVEQDVQDYKTSNSVIDLGAQGVMYLESVKEYEKQKSQIDIQLDVLNDITGYINKNTGRAQTAPSLLLVNDPALGSLVQKLFEAESKLESVRSISGEKSESVIVAEEEVSRLKAALKDNVSNTRQGLLAARQNLRSKIGMNSSMLNRIPRQERGLVEISRQREIKNAIYTYLLQKREETALSFASTIPDLRVVEAAAGYGPIKPKAIYYYVLGFFAGLVLPAAFMWLKDQLNRKIMFRGDIEKRTDVPIVGEVVYSDVKDPIVISDNKRTVIAEQFRSLRTNLAFVGLNEVDKTLLITSSISGEGKSFIAVNLAVSLTLTGKKVVLLELDLRKPKISNLLKVKREPGISNYLVNAVNASEIQKATSIPNLTVIPSGPIPPNPSELISGSKFASLLQEMSAIYDYIIIDTAPVGPVIDAQIINKHANVTLFVVRHNHTPKMALKMLQELKEQEKLKHVCVVFNGLKKRGLSYAGSYQYGGYGAGGQDKSYYVDESPKPGIFQRIRRLFRSS
jgi:tyrosine-protein kinase Etk/Wzc